jgi:hypothetical protein
LREQRRLKQVEVLLSRVTVTRERIYREGQVSTTQEVATAKHTVVIASVIVLNAQVWQRLETVYLEDLINGTGTAEKKRTELKLIVI